MSLFDGNGMSPADVAAVTGNNGNGWGFGGDGAWWLLVLFLFMFNGNYGWGNGGGNNTTYNVDSAMQRGFDQSAIMSGINGINSGIAGLSQSICNGFNSAEVAASNRQIADLQQQFSSQMANMQSANAIQAQLAQCCCDNRAATNDLKYTVATEACADRSAISDALRDVIASNTANTQAILDKMCQQEIEAKNTEIANLRTQINMQNLAASQAAQTAQLVADNAAQTQYVVNRIAPYPVPSYQVPNPFGGYGWTNACGCTA